MRSRSIRATRAAGVVALAFTLALAVGVLAPTAAHASVGGGPSVTIMLGTRAELVNRVLVQVPVTGTCTPPNGAVSTFDDLSVMVQQAFGKALATGFGFTSVPCDGTPFTINVGVTTGGPVAFHNGSAVAQASLFASFSDGTSVTVGNGPLTIKIGS